MTPLEEIAPLSDVPVDIAVELDRRVMTTRDEGATSVCSCEWMAK